MREPSWSAIASIAKCIAWYSCSAAILNSIVALGGTVCSLLGFNHNQATTFSIILSVMAGYLMLRHASARQVTIHMVLAGLFVPAYFALKWVLTFLAPIISSQSIPGSDIFLVFANPMRPANAAVLVLTIPYALPRLLLIVVGSMKLKDSAKYVK